MTTELTHHALEGTTAATKWAVGSGVGGLVVAGLTISEIVGVAAGVASIIGLTVTTYWVVKEKRKAIALIDMQMEDEMRKREIEEAHG